MGDMADLAGDRAFDEWNEGSVEDDELPEGFIRGKRGVQRKEYETEEIPRPAPSAASDPNRDPRYDPARAPSPYEERSAARTRSARRWIVRALVGSAALAVIGWGGWFAPDWINNLLLISSGLGYGSAMVEADRLRRSRG